MIDYIIIGNGLAGISFSEIALNANKKILVFDNNSQPSSRVAGGLYNPVVLKRFSEVWKAKEQIDFAFPLYHHIQKKLNVTFDFELPILRKLYSIEEQNNWFQAVDKPNLSPFLDATLVKKVFSNIDSPFHYGKVNHTGYLNISVLIEAYSKYLQSINCFSNDTFDYKAIEFFDDHILYKNIKVKNIIFAEGFGLHANPYFNDLPLDGTKGELLIIKSPNLDLDVVIKSSVFILPIGNDLYKVGATYDWSDKSNTPTEAGKDELISKLKEIISCDFEIVNHFAGVRPTVKDRRPLVGTHPTYKQIHVLNGLGTRGVMLGPYLANQLFQHIENNDPLEKEIDIIRCYKKK
ncbi:MULTISPECIES: FAD-binding oxidoreductase [unclassified Flavobacterium]|uniref:NAD(P)/FAD-dependent oxidoreductase n=1 Tax=unclassified Flavobacterium TaxID=196869 RepID=UPI0012926933|nr:MULTISPECIES: FAD-dependent oxidoreductase [unclassified Flavobacterium]MQP51906.1 FAD-dependent oxidoreductase [Flavobacterium sp. LMO9]MQP61775.1 FAD-dependent oxidoreductase [Flavobacterium sp. LMO6]